MCDEFKLKWRIGLRTCCLMARMAGKFKAKIEIASDGLRADVADMMGVMIMQLTAGARFTPRIDVAAACRNWFGSHA